MPLFRRVADLFRRLKTRFRRQTKDKVVVKEDSRAIAQEADLRLVEPQTATAATNNESAIIPTAPQSRIVPRIFIRTATEPAASQVDDHAPPSPISLSPSPKSRRNSESSSHQSQSDSNSSATSSRHWLKEKLENARLECPQRPHSFLVPRSAQKDLVTIPQVTKDIQADNPELDEKEAVDRAQKVCSSARQLYATLAYIKKGPEICALLNEGISDKDLPFERKPNSQRKFALYRRTGEPIKTLEAWSDKYLEKFDRVQWWMTAPIFEDKGHHDLDDKTILPFVPLDANIETPEKKQGGYSEVFPVQIHPAHHEFWQSLGPKDRQPLVAVKQLFSSDEVEFLKEVTILKALGPKNHSHLITLLGTYKHNQKYHLMFPYANANLRKYWDDHPKPEFDKETVLWTLKQMTGMASGLLAIHTFTVTYPLSVTGAGNVRLPKDVKLSVQGGEEWYGRHGDIKPENILWFSDGQGIDHPKGVLQIADFGLGRFHGRDSRSEVNPDTVLSSPTYEPPECKLRQPVSRAYDIWSLGCLYLEFITWLLRGSAEIDGFSEFRGREATATGINDDNFFTIITTAEGPKATVREQVITWINKLHAHKNCSQLVHDLLDLIMKDLLVTESKDRGKASWVFQQLNLYLKKAEQTTEYLLKPVPRQQEPESGHSNSTPTVLDPTQLQGKRNSVTFLDQDKPTPIKTRTKTQLQLPKDLVLRNLGTPSFKPKSPVPHKTWPFERVKT